MSEELWQEKLILASGRTRKDADRWLAGEAEFDFDALWQAVSGRESVSLALLNEAFFIRQHGERAPGGNENWRDWERKTETYLRSLLPEPDRADCTHPAVSWHGLNFDRGECQDCGAYVPPAPTPAPETADNVTALFEAREVAWDETWPKPRLQRVKVMTTEPDTSASPAPAFTGRHTAGECGCGKTHDATGALALNLVR
jgi:hypothetical protein